MYLRCLLSLSRHHPSLTDVLLSVFLPGELLLDFHRLAGIKLDPEAHRVRLMSCWRPKGHRNNEVKYKHTGHLSRPSSPSIFKRRHITEHDCYLTSKQDTDKFFDRINLLASLNLEVSWECIAEAPDLLSENPVLATQCSEDMGQMQTLVNTL